MLEGVEEFGFRRLDEVVEFADKLLCIATSIGETQPGISNDLRRAARELRQLVALLRCAMAAPEDHAVISLDSEARIRVSTKPSSTRLFVVSDAGV